MSPQTRSQTNLFKKFQQNAKNIFNFIPTEETSMVEYIPRGCLNHFCDCETDEEIYIRITQLHILWRITDLQDSNKYYEGNARTAHRYPRIKTDAFTGEIYNCPNWLAENIQLKTFQLNELRKKLVRLNTKMTERSLEIGVMPKPCEPPCDPKGMMGRSWWKMLGYNGACGCAWKKMHDPTNICCPLPRELECYKYYWDMPTYKILDHRRR